MADVKISELPAATTPLAGSEQIPLVQSGATKQVTVDGLFTSANLGTPSAISLTNATNVPVNQATGVLPVNHGGTGTTTPALVAGTNVTISGTWPNQTINSVAGAVTGVTATSPVVSSGGTTPDISMAAASASANGYLTSTDWNTFNNKQPAGSYLTSGGALGTPSSGTATNLTGLPLTTGVTGTLPVGNGGTGATTLTGIVKGNGTSAFSAATAGTDYVEPGGALGTPSSGTATNLTGLPLSTGVTGLLPVANGGTGTATPALVAGTNVTISGTWPNQTINASGGGGSGDVTGPASSTDNAVARFDSTTGKIIQNSGVVINDLGEVSVGVWKGTEVGLSYGGTGASSASQARGNILPSYAGNAGKVLAVNVGATDAEWIAAGGSGTVTSVAVSGGTTGLTTSGGPITAAGTITLAGTLAVANGGTGVTTSTGSGNVVLSTSPTLVTPVLGTPASATLSNATGLPLTTGVTGVLPVANGGTGVTTSTGTGSTVLSNSPSLVTPALGTPTSATLTNATGLPLSTGVTGTLPVANGGTGVTTSTGTGSVVLSTSPTLVTPVLGTPTSATLTNATGLPLSTGVTGTLPIANGGTGATTLAGASIVTYTGTETLTNKTLTNPTVTNYVETLYAANTGTAITVSLANGTVQQLTLTGNATITMPTAVAGKSFIIMLKQDATGSRSVTWTTVVWPGGTAPTITGTASKQDIYSFFSDGTNWYGTTVGQNY